MEYANAQDLQRGVGKGEDKGQIPKAALDVLPDRHRSTSYRRDAVEATTCRDSSTARERASLEAAILELTLHHRLLSVLNLDPR